MIGTDFVTRMLPHYADPAESVTLQGRHVPRNLDGSTLTITESA